MAWKISFVRTRFESPKYRVAVQPSNRVPFKTFLNWASQRSTLSPADIKAVVEAMVDWIADCATQGKTCDLGDLGGSQLSVRGAFDDIPDQIQKEDLEFKISWRLSGEVMRRLLLTELDFERVLSKSTTATYQVRALLQGNRWELDHWRPGGRLRITGRNLKFDPAQEDEGIFLVPGSQEAVRATDFDVISGGRIFCTVPQELAGAGEVELQIRRRKSPESALTVERHANSLTEST